ncbi:MAG TPA: hypothetical protein P5047_02320, partial [Desulfomonilia bacterium]|nr:hypothetical protein [Desulfomonilia bacterium]
FSKNIFAVRVFLFLLQKNTMRVLHRSSQLLTVPGYADGALESCACFPMLSHALIIFLYVLKKPQEDQTCRYQKNPGGGVRPV